MDDRIKMSKYCIIIRAMHDLCSNTIEFAIITDTFTNIQRPLFLTYDADLCESDDDDDEI